MLQLAATNAAYIAGLIDGEGCIYIRERQPSSAHGEASPSFRLQLQIANTHRGVLTHVQALCGGAVNRPDGHTPRPKADGSPRKTCWQWSSGSSRARSVLMAIEPYLIVKRDQALLAIEFADIVTATRHRPRSRAQPKLLPEDIEQRRAFARRLKALKHI